MAKDFIQVNVPSSSGKNLLTYSNLEPIPPPPAPPPPGQQEVHSEGVTLTDSDGNEITAGNPLPVAVENIPLVDIDSWLGLPAPTVGQKTMADSLPVAIASDQSPVPISAAALPLPAGAATEDTLGAGLAAIFTRQADGSQDTSVNNFPAVQPISAAALPLPAGAATEDTLGAGLAAIFTRQADGSQDTSVNNFPAVQPISAAALPLPAGAATEDTLATRLADATFTGRINTLGQKVMAASTPVVIANDQSPVPVSDGAAGVTAVTIMQNAAVAPGNGVSLTVTGYGAALFDVTGGFTAVIDFQASVDAGVTWFSINATKQGVSSLSAQEAVTSVANTIGLYLVSCPGVDLIRAKIVSYTGGTVTVKGRATNAVLGDKYILGQVSVINFSGTRLTVSPDVPGTLVNGAPTAVAGVVVSILAANPSRKAAILQNIGAANVRVGVAGVTATTGTQVVAGATMILEMPFCPPDEIFAIREGGVSSTILASQIT